MASAFKEGEDCEFPTEIASESTFGGPVRLDPNAGFFWSGFLVGLASLRPQSAKPVAVLKSSIRWSYMHVWSILAKLVLVL